MDEENDGKSSVRKKLKGGRKNKVDDESDTDVSSDDDDIPTYL